MAAPASAEAPGARCEATSFRVYFAQGSSRLSPAALETLEAAARNIAACDYAELNVSIDGTSPQAARRAAAIRAAASSHDWDAVRVTPRMLTQAAVGPAYAEVTMATQPTPNSRPAQAAAGV